MMRQANSALRLLLRLQAARAKREADAAATDRAAWTEHCALGLMAEALAHRPDPERAGNGATSALVAGAGEEESTAGAGGIARGGQAEGNAASAALAGPGLPLGEPDLVAAAERYAAEYPERAAAIRRTGKLPPDVRYFCPSEAALARALITARTPALAALDGLPIGAPIRATVAPDRAMAEA